MIRKSNLRLVRASELRVGMFVLRSGDGEIESPMLEHNMLLRSEDDVERLRCLNQPIYHVDLFRSRRLPAPLEARPATPAGVKECVSLLSRGGRMADRVITEVRAGKGVSQESVSEVRTLIGETMRQIAVNEASLMAATLMASSSDASLPHAVNVLCYSLLVAKSLGHGEEYMRRLGLGAFFHDLGKAFIPPDVLNRKGRLSDEEHALVRRHPELGADALEDLDIFDADILTGIRQHHERWRGAGYPDGVSGEAIHPFARILAVVDVYDALTNDRTYRPACPPAEAVSRLYAWRDQDFEPESVVAFIRAIGVYPVGSFVRLNDGRLGKVVRTNPRALLKPMVRIVSPAARKPGAPSGSYLPQEYLDLAAPTADPELAVESAVDLAFGGRVSPAGTSPSLTW